MSMASHVKLVAALHIGLGALNLAGAGIAFLILAGGGLLSGDLKAIAITSGIGLFVLTVVLVTSLPSIVGGLGLLGRKNWARVLLLIVAAFDLFHFPLGTVLAVYTFWVLLNERTSRLFASAAA